jgi:fused signal recognition particle receptor
MLGWFKKKKKPVPVEEQTHPDNGAVTPHQEHSRDSVSEAQPTTETEQLEPELDTVAGGNLFRDEPDQTSGVSESKSVFKKLSERLSRSRASFTQRIDEIVLGKKEIDAELFDDLEEVLVTADLGIKTTQELLEQARQTVKRDELSDPQVIKSILRQRLKEYLTAHDQPAELEIPEGTPLVIMVVGVNGVGKTTTIGKIARKFINDGQSVLLVAADTFRAAATSQLQIWGERNNVRVVAQHEGADPSAVVFDAMSVASAKNYNVVLVDTAGRLHTKVNLMEELKKIKRVMGKQLEGAPHEILLVIDATTGQNGISQAILFDEAVGVTGIALTKLDGTAKGGIIANISNELKLPIRFIGVGEQADDLRDFDADEYLEALFE